MRHAIAVPTDWPEAIAWRAGARLFLAEEDEVLGFLRQGLPIDQHLDRDEIEARFTLGQGPFERWLRLGWARAAGSEED